jgi:hypothetical protein
MESPTCLPQRENFVKHLILLISLLAMACLNAQENDEAEAPPAAPAPPNCESEKHHQFDFWIGDWTVYSGETVAGHNSITTMYDGCVLVEHWVGASGNEGQSFNTYDRGYDKWHQTWVSAGGQLLELDGGFVDGNMVLSGKRPTQDGTGEATHKITYTPNEDGTVRQHWEVSRDGDNWTTLFDGLYKKDHE